MSDKPVITLTTDFGYRDHFAGVMKGVILKINPHATIVDLSHGISRQDIREAALTVGMNYRYFPDQSIHVVVVDPGVGSERRPLLVRADGHFFVGPDNGVFSVVFKMAASMEVYHVTSKNYFLSEKSPTFQGRDVFAPVAAWLSTGIEPAGFGTAVKDFRTVPLPSPVITERGVLKGEVLHIDHFGNALTNIHQSDLSRIRAQVPLVSVIAKGREVPLRRFYSEAAPDELCALINSSGYLEVFVNLGSAAERYGLSLSDPVEVLRCE